MKKQHLTMRQCQQLAYNGFGPDPWLVWLFALELFYEDREP